MENQERKKTLFIPSNVKTKTEFFKGFGVDELKKTAILTALIGVLIYLLYYQRSENVIVLVVAIMASAGVGVAIFSKDERNQSMVDTMGHMLRFVQHQKFYPYRFSKEDWYIDR